MVKKHKVVKKKSFVESKPVKGLNKVNPAGIGDKLADKWADLFSIGKKEVRK